MRVLSPIDKYALLPKETGQTDTYIDAITLTIKTSYLN